MKALEPLRCLLTAPRPRHREPGSQQVAPRPAPLAVPPPQPVSAQGVEPQGSHDVAATVIASLCDASHQRPAGQKPGTSEPPPAPSPAPPVPTDAIGIAGELRAAPMAPSQQVQVLDLVTQIATMVRDLKTENAQLRADVSRSSTDTTARLADFERRLALAEARNAVSAAKAAGTEPAAPAPSAVPVKAAAAPVMLTRAEATLPVPEKDGPKRYRVQAASPGLALLAEVDRGGGEGAQIQLTVGDTLPGYGRVRSIAQHGTTWVVTTDHGNIQ